MKKLLLYIIKPESPNQNVGTYHYNFYTNLSNPNPLQKKSNAPKHPPGGNSPAHNISHNLSCPPSFPRHLPSFFLFLFSLEHDRFSFVHPSTPLARYRIPEFDNRIWPPFAERAYVRSADMQMIAVGCIERDASGRVATVGNPWSWRSEVGSAVLRRHLTTVENASPFGVCFREEKRWESGEGLTLVNDRNTCCAAVSVNMKQDES